MDHSIVQVCLKRHMTEFIKYYK